MVNVRGAANPDKDGLVQASDGSSWGELALQRLPRQRG